MAKVCKNELWSRRVEETSSAFEAFVGYRDMGARRSIRGLAQKLGRNDAHLFEWSNKFDWQKRCAAWDEFLDEQGRTAQIASVKEMKRRQAKLAKKAQEAARLGFKTLIGKLTKDIEKAEEEGKSYNQLPIKAEALAKLLDVGCRLERLNLDEPEQNIKVLGEDDYENLSLDEMEQLRSLLQKSKGER